MKIASIIEAPSTWHAWAVCQRVCTSEFIILVSPARVPRTPNPLLLPGLTDEKQRLRFCLMLVRLNENLQIGAV